MITEEELVIFECELNKLMEEYRKCVDQPLKLKIHEDIAWLEMAIFLTGSYEQSIKN